MVITKKEWIEQLATLYAYGLPQKDDWELAYWYRTIESEKMTKDSVENAVLEMTKRHTKFWDTDNIPAMIIQTADAIRKKEKLEAHANRMKLAKKKQEEERAMAVASWGGTEEEAKANREKIQTMLKGLLK